MVLELQRLFYRLQYAAARGACEVGTEGLTRSFGWGAREVLEQQDVQEFGRMLCETLQEHMRASGRPDDVARLFEGSTLNSIRCTRVDFRSEREERWYDLQMPVQGCGGLRASLGSFVREEKLSGDNRYNTRRPELGRQEARRGARLKSVPPVLQLHLKRFEYDARSGEMLKLQQVRARHACARRVRARHVHGMCTACMYTACARCIDAHAVAGSAGSRTHPNLSRTLACTRRGSSGPGGGGGWVVEARRAGCGTVRRLSCAAAAAVLTPHDALSRRSASASRPLFS